jgi:hypothetical protein
MGKQAHYMQYLLDKNVKTREPFLSAREGSEEDMQS